LMKRDERLKVRIPSWVTDPAKVKCTVNDKARECTWEGRYLVVGEVKKGETLWKIAEQYYGDGALYPKIFEANRDILKDPDRINIGQKLRIP